MAAGLLGCDSSSDSARIAEPGPDKGPYAHQTGATEPLYPFQWALNYDASYFSEVQRLNSTHNFHGGLDLNVEPAHRAEHKGQGVRVVVLDSGVDLRNEDLNPNADWGMSWNFSNGFPHDPYPGNYRDHNQAPHGTAVAGIIAAAQNGKGVMGIAPQVVLGAANVLSSPAFGVLEMAQAYGGAEWSRQAHLFNASYGLDANAPSYDDLKSADPKDFQTPILRGLKSLRGGLGALFIRSAGNSFSRVQIGAQAFWPCGAPESYYPCVNPANDHHALEANVITVAALNTLGQASSYSSGGAVVWVAGMAGEYGESGDYGERPGANGADGPTIYTTDMSGCTPGYSYDGADTAFLRGQTARGGVADNPDCDYGYMNGTSASAPTITGVAALVLGANPALGWRDVRDILRLSSRPVDLGYAQRIPGWGTKPFGVRMDLSNNQLLAQAGTAADIHNGSALMPMDLGWQTNKAGLLYSNRYGFGVPDAGKAVALALEYKSDPSRSRRYDVGIPDFQPAVYWYADAASRQLSDEQIGHIPAVEQAFPYQVITEAGTITMPEGVVDQFQLRFSSRNVCLGSVGLAVKSPQGTLSLLKLPHDHFQMFPMGGSSQLEILRHGTGSYAFYGEPAQGEWTLYVLAASPDGVADPGPFGQPCKSPASGGSADYEMFLEARVVAQ